jgi:hypothetical protein
MQRFSLFFILLFPFLFGCNEAPTNRSKRKINEPELQTNSQAQILNSIVVHEKGGLEIARAFLAYENGSLLQPGNTVLLGDVVCLNLVIKQGWVAENGFVSIGATQTLITKNGAPVLSSSDLFAGTPKIEESKASHLQLKTTITKGLPDAGSFVVNYRVWDKTGDGEVTGNYRLYFADEKGK